MGPVTNKGFIGDTWLILHGTKTMPAYRLLGPRKYDFHYNRLDNSNNNYNDYNEYDNSINNTY